MSAIPIWTPWSGGDQPVPDDTIVKVKYRGPEEMALGIRIEWPCSARFLAWRHDGQDDDIVAYRIVEVAP